MYMLKNPHVINLMFQCNNLPWAEGFAVEMGGDLCNRDIYKQENSLILKQHNMTCVDLEVGRGILGVQTPWKIQIS